MNIESNVEPNIETQYLTNYSTKYWNPILNSNIKTQYWSNIEPNFEPKIECNIETRYQNSTLNTISKPILVPKFFWIKHFLTSILLYQTFLELTFWTTTTTATIEMGFDTIEINLVSQTIYSSSIQYQYQIKYNICLLYWYKWCCCTWCSVWLATRLVTSIVKLQSKF